MHEADDGVVAGVDLQQHAGVFADGVFVVACLGLVGRADLDQLAAGLAHYVGHAVAAADLDHVGAAAGHLFALRQGVQDDHGGGGVVVHHGGGFGAGDACQKAVDQLVAVAALAAGAVQLEARIAGALAHGGFHCALRQRCAAERRVQDHAGGVDHAAQYRLQQRGDALLDQRCQRRFGQLGLEYMAAFAQVAAQHVQRGTGFLGDKRAPGAGDQRGEGPAGQQGVQLGQVAQTGGFGGVVHGHSLAAVGERSNQRLGRTLTQIERGRDMLRAWSRQPKQRQRMPGVSCAIV